VLPTVSITRFLRNAVLAVWHGLRRDRSYAEVERERDRQNRRSLDIAFVGVFDTVEAYGVPINELRSAVNWAIWPISFRNLMLNPRVHRARHALCLDDERTTFHPVQFHMTAADHAGPVPRIREVWFAGVHSDVGGGYPDDGLAHVPLVWMMREAEQAGGGENRIRFKSNKVAEAEQSASALAQMHDSRAGLSALYRYGPRCIASKRPSRSELKRLRGTVELGVSEEHPIVHHSVPEKMVFGTENYAPLTLPHVAHVLMPDGQLGSFQGFQDEVHRRFGDRLATAQPTPEDTARRAIASLIKPNADYVGLTRDLIWWRRIGYFALLGALLVVASLPWTASWLNQRLTVFLIRSSGTGCRSPGSRVGKGIWRTRRTVSPRTSAIGPPLSAG
jgi:hypothetical protein